MANTEDQFSGVMIDPPWAEFGAGKIKRGADKHYEIIKSWQEIVRVIQTSGVWDDVGEDAHLFLWSTSNHEAQAHKVIDALGFRHFQSIPWTKPGNMGIGRYFRGCHEPLMFAVRGKGMEVRSPDNTMRSDYLVGAPRIVDAKGKRVHSGKPKRAFEMVEQRTVGPLLEMFARGAPFSDRWDVWGEEAMVDGEPADEKAAE